MKNSWKYLQVGISRKGAEEREDAKERKVVGVLCVKLSELRGFIKASAFFVFHS